MHWSLLIVFPLLFYMGFILRWRKGIQLFQIPCNTLPGAKVSVVIPFQNEAAHLPMLIKSLQSQLLPDDFTPEYIFVNDGSTDNGASILREKWPEAIILNLPDPRGKKAALTEGISKAQGEHIATTDADVVPEKTWLWSLLKTYLESDVHYIAGPVVPKQSKTLFGRLVALEFFSLQAITEGSFARGEAFMSNAANSIFRKTIWESACTGRTDDFISSGDDVFLLQYIAGEYGQKYLKYSHCKDSAVYAQFPESLISLWRQRNRWAGKTPYYRHLFPKVLAVVLFAVCVYQLVGWYFSPYLWAVVWIGKTATDFAILQRITRKYEQAELMRYFPVATLIYPVYIAVIGVSVLLQTLRNVLFGYRNPIWKSP
jgi:poly-beta-1,6-N-acetyl-D-glucosamine synthase